MAELEADIKWQKERGVASNIIAVKEKRLAKLKKDRGPK